MNLPAQVAPLSVAEYLEGEQCSDVRHEYVAGQVFAMAGAGEKHNRIAGNLFFHLRAATRGTPCGTFISDMKVRVDAHDAFYYPDVLLDCDPDDSEPLYKRSPCLIAEVLSPWTEVIDRREKLLAYRALESLRYYLLVSQEWRLVEVYRRDPAGGWHYDAYEDGELLIDCGGLEVRFGVLGLGCRQWKDGRRRSLKKLFQEAAVPPWVRPYVPLLFAHGKLVAVADLCTCFADTPVAAPVAAPVATPTETPAETLAKIADYRVSWRSPPGFVSRGRTC